MTHNEKVSKGILVSMKRGLAESDRKTSIAIFFMLTNPRPTFNPFLITSNEIVKQDGLFLSIYHGFLHFLAVCVLHAGKIRQNFRNFLAKPRYQFDYLKGWTVEIRTQ